MDDTIPPLIDRVLSGDVDAFGQLIARLRPRFGRYAWHMLGNREDAEEAVQDTFIRAYRRLATCRDPARFDAWAFQILVNRCRTARRRSIRHGRALVFHDEALEQHPVEHPADARAWREEIDRALGGLTPEQREAFLLRYVEGMPYEEMTRWTGARVSALKMRVLRACERLRHELAGARND